MTAALAGASALGFTEAPWPVAVAAIASAMLITEAPQLIVPTVFVVGVGAAWRRLRRRRRRTLCAAEDLAGLCDLTAIALTGGLGLQAAVEIAATHVGGELEAEVSAVLARARVDGLAVAMEAAGGAGRRLYRIVGQAAAAGSSLLDPVVRLAEDLNADLAAKRLEEVRRLPVSMLFPLTILILPGFMLLAIAPAVLNAFARLEL